MKLLIIGDLHGKNYWEEIRVNRYDKIIFLGDYVDHWNESDEHIYRNLQNLILLKEEYPERLELLLGNHDIQYLHYPKYLCSGFRQSMQPELSRLFNLKAPLFKIAWQKNDHIFTHAGITNAWYREFLQIPRVAQLKEENDTLAGLLNKTEQTAERDILHRAGVLRGGYGSGGVTWADRQELASDMLTGYHQVVGHTITREVIRQGNADQSVTFIDVLDYQTYFHEMEL